MFNFLKTLSYKEGAFLSVSSTFVWKLLSFVNSILLAFYFGTRIKADIYFYLILFVGLISLFFSNLNNLVLLPQAIFLKNSSEEKPKYFLNIFFWFYLMFFFLISFLGLFYGTDILLVLSNFTSQEVTKDIWLVRLSFIYLGSYVLYLFLFSVSTMYKFFSINILSILNALSPMICLIFWHSRYGIKTMLIGFIIACIAQSIFIYIVLRKKLNWPLKCAKISFEKKFKQDILSNQILVLLSLCIEGCAMFLFSGFGVGYVSSLTYAKQLADSSNEIIITRVSSVYSVQFNEAASSNNYAKLNFDFIKINYFVLFIIIPLSFFTCYFATDIIKLFFERGAFNQQSVIDTVKFLRPLMLYSIMLVLWCFGETLVATCRKIKESFRYLLFKNILIILLVYFGIKFLGPFAYPYMLIIGLIIGYFILGQFYKKFIPEISLYSPLKPALKIGLLNFISLIITSICDKVLSIQTPLLNILICGTIFVGILFLLLLICGEIKKLLILTLAGKWHERILIIFPRYFHKYLID